MTGYTSPLMSRNLAGDVKIKGEWLSNPHFSVEQLIPLRDMLDQDQLNHLACNPNVALSDMGKLRPTHQMMVAFFMYNPNARLEDAIRFGCNGFYANNPNYSVVQFVQTRIADCNTSHNPDLHELTCSMLPEYRYMSPRIKDNEMLYLILKYPQFALNSCSVNMTIEYNKLCLYDRLARNRKASGPGIFANFRTINADNESAYAMYNPNSNTISLWNHGQLHKYKVMQYLRGFPIITMGCAMYSYHPDCVFIF